MRRELLSEFQKLVATGVLKPEDRGRHHRPFGSVDDPPSNRKAESAGASESAFQKEVVSMKKATPS